MEVLEKTLNIKPNDPQALNDLAWAYAQLNTNLIKAVSVAEEAHKLAPQRKEVLDTLVVCNTRLGFYYLKKFKLIGSIKAFVTALNYKIKFLRN